MIVRIWNALQNLLYPKRANCMGCGAATGCREDWICPACRQDLAWNWVGAQPTLPYLDAAAHAYVYRGAAAGVVRRLKYSGVGRLAKFMGADMIRAYRFIEPTGADCVTCVPMHKKRLKKRGYNHAGLLARDVAARLGLPYVEALERVRNTPQQARLNDRDRRQNLKDAFAIRESPAGRRIILVDDVCTTGSTAVACAKTLKSGGAERVFLLCYTLARKEK